MFMPANNAMLRSLAPKEDLSRLSDSDLALRGVYGSLYGNSGGGGMFGLPDVMGDPYFQESNRRSAEKQKKDDAAKWEAALPLEERIALNNTRDVARRQAMPQQTSVFTGTYGQSQPRNAFTSAASNMANTYSNGMKNAQQTANSIASRAQPAYSQPQQGYTQLQQDWNPIRRRSAFTWAGKPAMGQPQGMSSSMGMQQPRYREFVGSVLPKSNYSAY